MQIDSVQGGILRAQFVDGLEILSALQNVVDLRPQNLAASLVLGGQLLVCLWLSCLLLLNVQRSCSGQHCCETKHQRHFCDSRGRAASRVRRIACSFTDDGKQSRDTWRPAATRGRRGHNARASLVGRHDCGQYRANQTVARAARNRRRAGRFRLCWCPCTHAIERRSLHRAAELNAN